ncbi:hypothetical protein GALMADRAFT_135579 [Galerina marginata CBS 339.88]|uniref:C2H2-type domain-containing protein n=1 Tax=Galerina marginata (strain CBS 339.88) TaxID=685588 RepID=A0A067TG63_GALM3|nr:hypothetical protein GALMADRAFT_135579 [Galerina marginata CBS 339.88]
MPPQQPTFQSFDCLHCGQKCRSSGGLRKHQESRHPKITLPEEATRYTRICHPHINGRPCAADGLFLPIPIPDPIPDDPSDAPSENPWAPFVERSCASPKPESFIPLL